MGGGIRVDSEGASPDDVEPVPMDMDPAEKMKGLVAYLKAGYRSAQKPAPKSSTPRAGRTVVEQDDHFHVTDAGGSFKVAKRGLDDATHQKIRGMCSGGEVKGYSDGGAVKKRPGVPAPADLELLNETFPAEDAPLPDTAGGLPGRAIRAVGRGLVSLVDDPTRHEWWDAPGSTTPDGSPAPAAGQAMSSAAAMLPARSGPEARMRGVRPAPMSASTFQPDVPTPPPASAPRNPGGGGGSIPGLDPKELEMAKATQAQASQQEQAALAEQGQAEHAAAMAQAEGLKAKATGEADLIAHRQRMEADRQQAVTTALTAYQRAVDEYGRAGVDPGRYWADASTGQKVLAGIGLLFGALGAGHDGVNKSVSIINQAIDRDIDAQKENLAKLGNKVAMRRGILGDIRAKFQDDAVADQAAADSYRQHAATLAEEMAARTQDPVRQAQLKALAAGVLGSGGEKRLAMVTGVQARAAEIAVAKQKLAQGWAAIAAKGAGKGGGKQMTAEQQERMAGAQNAYQALETIEREIDKIGPGASPSALVPGTRAYRFSDKAKAAATVFGKFLEGQRFSDADRKHYESLMPSMSDSAVRQKEKIQQGKTLLRNKYGAELQTMGQAGFNVSGFRGQGEPSSGGAPEEDDE